MGFLGALRFRIYGPLILSLLLLPGLSLALDQPAAEHPEQASILGVVKVFTVDNLNGTTRDDRELLPLDGAPIHLRSGSHSLDDLQTNDIVEVAGELLSTADGRRELQVEEYRKLVAAPLRATQSLEGHEERSVVVMRVKFGLDGSDGEVPCSLQEVKGLMWDNPLNVDGLFRANSFDQLGFARDSNLDGEADLVNVTIEHSVTESCYGYGTWGAAADDAAVAQGINPDDFQHKIYVLPSVIQARCGWAGIASLPGDTVWISLCDWPDVYAHELGHNLGLHHASTDNNNDGDYLDPGEYEYGDLSCPMGFPDGLRHFNAMHKDYLNWIPESSIAAVSATGTYSISATDIAPDSLPPGLEYYYTLTHPVPSRPDWTYYVSYRVRDDNYSSQLRSTFDQRTTIHTRNPDQPHRSYLVAVLGDNQSFQDGDFRVVQVAHYDEYAAVTIETSPEPTPTPSATPTPSPTPTPTLEPTPTPTPTPTPNRLVTVAGHVDLITDDPLAQRLFDRLLAKGQIKVAALGHLHSSPAIERVTPERRFFFELPVGPYDFKLIAPLRTIGYKIFSKPVTRYVEEDPTKINLVARMKKMRRGRGYHQLWRRLLRKLR